MINTRTLKCQGQELRFSCGHFGLKIIKESLNISKKTKQKKNKTKTQTNKQTKKQTKNKQTMIKLCFPFILVTLC